MANNRTFTMIKPDAIAQGNEGAIIQKITNSGFKILALKMTRLSREKAQAFYAVHEDKGFFEGLVDFMTSGPIIAAILEKKNAVEDFRALIGSTNPEEALEGTIRNLFASNIQENAVHGSDSDENAAIEAAFHFNDDEIVTY
ncbi:nucleoside-diphosphate kinase [Wenyingzhuangia sp. 2_MG-2023]|uniref:nucleoside-diphosphate kinase n=1 Tax=Wenyingzhuangia sp. 2_MG-2023 TaxID=3062639 RepID=UPI0026E1B68D|nr:nucleoside-diphosphate kinase [Wenyingzhuangia sp. 2_MG-2023]MDO6738319.1 nucleoside-diphosphate kinase [Wenyingzhuangia sp. 2_MG-2023]MDO6802197.1 nucleoside-diphosphate kinase [Wenyingzhuangia sp. 1_MG-2023]